MTDTTPNAPRTPLYDTTGGDPLAGRPVHAGGTDEPLITESYVPVPPTGGTTGSGSTASGSGSSGSGKADAAKGKADAAKGEAKAVAGDAAQAAGETVGSAAEQAKAVAGEATGQAKQLFGQATGELRDQAGQQQQRVAEGLRTVGGELSDMAEKSDSSGLAGEVVRNLSGRAHSVAGWLEGRDPGSLLDDVKQYAARKPGTFIAIAAVSGLFAGRVVKSLTAEAKAQHESTTGTGTTGASASTGTSASGTHVQGTTAGGSAAGVGPVAGEYDVVETGTVPGSDDRSTRGGAAL
ncbi:hypothetical protein [Frigoribacterium salinisoli]